MSTETDVDLLFDLFLTVQDLMKQHEIIDSSLKELSLREDGQDFTTLENASHEIINSCNKMENRLSIRKRPSCCHG